jgi:hypothetical protein
VGWWKRRNHADLAAARWAGAAELPRAVHPVRAAAPEAAAPEVPAAKVVAAAPDAAVAKAAVAPDAAAAAPDAAVVAAVATAPDAAAVAPDVAVAEVVAMAPDVAAAAPDVAEVVVGPAQAAAFYLCRDHLEPPVRLQVIHPAVRREPIRALPRTRSSRPKTVPLRLTSDLVLELEEADQY